MKIYIAGSLFVVAFLWLVLYAWYASKHAGRDTDPDQHIVQTALSY